MVFCYLLHPIAIADMYNSHSQGTFFMGMSNCLYLMFFLSSLFATIIFTNVPVPSSNQNSIDIRGMLNTYLIFDCIIAGSLAYPFWLFSITLNTVGYKNQIFLKMV